MRSRFVMMPLGALFLTVSLPALAAGIRVESIDGAETVSLHRGYHVREAAAGEEIFPGEQIQTGADTTAVIAYPDGTKVSLLPLSNFQLEEPDHSLQFSQLNWGGVHGVVPKGAPPAAAPGKRGMKFIIRTRSAVMGVRGTDFLVGVHPGGGAADFHTLEGKVEVASHTTDLLGGKGVPIESGKGVRAAENGKLGPVHPFTPSELRTSYPGLVLAQYPALQKQIELSAPPKPSLKSPETPVEDSPDQERGYLLAFALGGSFTSHPPGPALGLYWTPVAPLPFYPPIFVRGSVGFLHVLDDKSDSGFVSLKEYQIFFGTQLHEHLFVEAGGGLGDRAATTSMFTGQAGWIIGRNAVFHRLFLGVSRTLGSDSHTDLRFGAGFQFL
jgi:hypothetical protein